MNNYSRQTPRNMTHPSRRIMKLLLNLFLSGLCVNGAAQTGATPIAEKIELIAPDKIRILKIYTDTIVTDTLTVSEWIWLQSDTCKTRTTKEIEKSNRQLEQINEQMKKPDE